MRNLSLVAIVCIFSFARKRMFRYGIHFSEQLSNFDCTHHCEEIFRHTPTIVHSSWRMTNSTNKHAQIVCLKEENRKLVRGGEGDGGCDNS